MPPSIAESASRAARPVVFLGRNALSIAGAVLTTSSAITMIAFWTFELLSGEILHPYEGILFFLILPGVFALGLVLMPLGIFIRRRKLVAADALPATFPKVDLNEPFFRNAAALLGVLTFLNVVIMSTASYKGVEYMDSSEFCGQACHTVMQPEWTAFADSPHSRVGCARCHIGPGAPWFVKAKLSGVRQILAVAFDTHSRPIPSPVHDLRPARETCEQCHWPQKNHGDAFKVRVKYDDDEKNTRLTTVMVVKIGGTSSSGGTGIHGRHLNVDSPITYTAIDAQRQVIPRVSWIDPDGQEIVFTSVEVQATPAELAAGETRVMDCVDCHNRPTHAFELAGRAIDAALSDGRISQDLPFVKKKAVELIEEDYPDRETASARIPAALIEFYREEYPEVYSEHPAIVERAANAARDAYLRNVFPQMNVTWGTYIDNIGHEDYLGCFRCHDDEHESSDGRVLSQDCDSCHSILAMEEEAPEVLSDLGLSASTF